jgi:hypothetical protein
MVGRMTRSFGLVDEKLAEADFFLDKLNSSLRNPFEARCYFSAFVSAARSVTFVLQAVMRSQVDDFDEWYAVKQVKLGQDSLARFFHHTRNDILHEGLNPRNAGSMRVVDGQSVVELYFRSTTFGVPLKNAPLHDVVTSCTQYLTSLVALIRECYDYFGSKIDPHQYLTEENFRRLSLTIEDAEEQIIGIRGWTAAPGVSLEARWQMLRDSTPGSEIAWIFKKYLD